MSSALLLPLEQDVLARVDALAAERSMTRSDVMMLALIDFLEAQTEELGEFLPWQEEKIQAGLAAAERGDFASDEEVERVFAQYGA